MDAIRAHIKQFPVMPSHYCRATTKRKYLSQNLSVAKMYDLYVEECLKPLSLKQYRHVFNTEFNLGFHVPKKDECKNCTCYTNTSSELKKKLETEHQKHLKNKEIARKEKDQDKSKAAIDPAFRSFTFDLQQVLSTPASNTSVLFYKRKLSSHNFTVYNQQSGEGTCFMWSEVNGRRGSCEIGTCLMKYLQQQPETVKHVTLFSDSCGGQNRNQFVAAGLLYMVRTSSISVIEQKILESGHTQMEVDSMHSCIEQAKKKTTVFHPDQWSTVASLAIRKRPYKVVQMRYNEFYDLKKLAGHLLHNVKKDIDGETVHWMKIKNLKFEKDALHLIKYMYGFDEEFQVLRVSASRRRKVKWTWKADTVLKSRSPLQKGPISSTSVIHMLSLNFSIVTTMIFRRKSLLSFIMPPWILSLIVPVAFVILSVTPGISSMKTCASCSKLYSPAGTKIFRGLSPVIERQRIPDEDPTLR